MKKIRRYMFNALTVLSLLLCVATALLWARSSTHREGVEYRYEKLLPDRSVVDRGGEIESFGSEIYLRNFRIRTHWPDHKLTSALLIHSVNAYSRRHAASPFTLSKLLIDWERIDDPDWNDLSLRVPVWMPVVLFATLPCVWIRRFKQGRCAIRLAQGRCATCGYDLRATPERCPECGTISTITDST